MYSNHCKAVEDWGNTVLAEKSIEVAKVLIKQNILPIDKIAEASGLSETEVAKIAEELKVSAEKVAVKA